MSMGGGDTQAVLLLKKQLKGAGCGGAGTGEGRPGLRWIVAPARRAAAPR
jgi:hypothetical protein